MTRKLVNNSLPSKFITLFSLLGLYMLFSLLTFKDYGITLDEPRVYTRGQQLLKYFSHKTSYKNTIEPTYNLEPKKLRHAPILSEYHNLYAAGTSVFNRHFSYERYHFFNMVFIYILKNGSKRIEKMETLI